MKPLPRRSNNNKYQSPCSNRVLQAAFSYVTLYNKRFLKYCSDDDDSCVLNILVSFRRNRLVWLKFQKRFFVYMYHIYLS